MKIIIQITMIQNQMIFHNENNFEEIESILFQQKKEKIKNNF